MKSPASKELGKMRQTAIATGAEDTHLAGSHTAPLYPPEGDSAMTAISLVVINAWGKRRI